MKSSSSRKSRGKVVRVAAHNIYGGDKRYVDFGHSKPQEKEEYIKWLSLPLEKREPATKVAMSEKLGVHLSTLQSWEKSEGWQVRREIIRRKLEPEVEEVLDALIESAKIPGKDGAADRARFLEIVGYNRKLHLEITHHDAAQEGNPRRMGDKDLAEAVVVEMIGRVAESFGISAEEASKRLDVGRVRRETIESLSPPAKVDFKALIEDAQYEIVGDGQ